MLHGSLLVSDVFERIVQGQEFDAFFLGVFYFLQAGRHFGLATAIDDIYLLGAQAFGGAAGVHGCISAAHHHDALGGVDGGVGFGVGGVHQVDTRQVLVARHDVHAVFARDVHKVGQAGTRGDEYALVAFLL